MKISQMIAAFGAARGWRFNPRGLRATSSATSRKWMAMFAVGAMALGVFADGVTVTGVTAKQRWPWNGKVDVEVTLSGTQADVEAAEYSFAATNTATAVAIDVSDVTPDGSATASGPSWTKKFVWNADTDAPEKLIDSVSLTVTAKVPRVIPSPGTTGPTGDPIPGAVQLWENGPYFATWNVGATAPEDYGWYFWWGDTVGYKFSGKKWVSVDGNNTSINFTSSGKAALTYNKNVDALKSAGFIDSTGQLVAEYDAAKVHFGPEWRLPTSDEIQALVANTTQTEVSQNGVSGWRFSGKEGTAYATVSLFFPFTGHGTVDKRESNPCGHCWAATPNSSQYAWSISTFSGGDKPSCFERYNRYLGYSVRAVRTMR